MGSLRSFVVVGLVLSIIQSNPTYSRPCSNRNNDVRRITTEASISLEVELIGTTDFVLYLLVNWTSDLSQYTSNLPLDGYAVRLFKLDHSSTTIGPPVLSTSTCATNSSLIWVNTTGEPNCENRTSNFSECGLEFCECPLENCSVLSYGRSCEDIKDYINDADEPYLQTVPRTVTSIRYPVEPDTQYQFDLLPYNRLYANQQAEAESFRPSDFACISHLTTLTDLDNARQLCCQKGLSALPYGAQQTDVVPIFWKTANVTKLNITVKWFPPHAYPNATFSLQLNPNPTDKIFQRKQSENTTDSDPTNCSSTPPYFYEAVIYDLEPDDGPHILTISTAYPGSTAFCRNGRCETRITLDLNVPEDLCRQDFNLCVPDAECTEGVDGVTGFTNSCICNQGYFGDGFTQGSGCKDLDMCDSPTNDCAEGAVCTDLPPPSIDVSCSCPDGFYGDGLRQGSGCASETARLLGILLPIALVLVIAAITITFCMRRRQHIAKNKQMQQFITDLCVEDGIISYYQDFEVASGEQRTWKPTFGKKWELDRNDIQFEDVVGKGNYGIVYKGYMSTENKGNDNGLDGVFYDPIKTSETYENDHSQSDDGTTVVAIKCLQESIHNHENLLNFMAEISFMLNIGSHENIVTIYGCSTTENPVFVVMEYLCYGDLLHFLWDAREPSKWGSDPIYRVTELSLSTMAKDVAKGMVHLQQIRVIHGDIAARNILVGANGICKLSDFGLSADVYRYGHIKQGIREIAVPIKWTSPERMMDGKYPITSKSDVWSYGNLLYEIFTLGCPLYPNIQTVNLLDTLRSGYRMSKPQSCSAEMYELMVKCWRWRASWRPTFLQVLKYLDSIIDVLKSQRITSAISVVENLDKELYENELNSTITVEGNKNSSGSPPHYENVYATESEM